MGRLPVLVGAIVVSGLCVTADSLAAAGDTSRVSVTSTGDQLSTWSETSTGQGISADGRDVVFETQAALSPADHDGGSSVYVRDLSDGSVTLMSTTASGTTGFGGYSVDPVISSDGSTVAFVSMAALVPGDTNGDFDVYSRSRVDPSTIERISVSTTGGNLNYTATTEAISATGRYVTYLTRASNAVSGDTNGRPDVFLRDTVADVTQRVSVGSNGEEFDMEGTQGAAPVSANGRYVAFTTSYPIDANDGNHQEDVYLRDTVNPSTQRISTTPGGGDPVGGSSDPAMSSDGAVIVFESCSDDLVANDSNGKCDIFSRTSLGPVKVVSSSLSGGTGNGHSQYPGVSANGRYATFASSASDLVAGDTNDQMDVFVGRLGSRPVLASVSSGGVAGNSSSFYPWASDDGRLVVFTSYASNLVPGDTNGERDVFVHELNADSTPPVVEGHADRPPNANGWYSAPVTIDWQSTDDSGSATDPADTVAASEGENVTYTSGPSCDGAGNCATGSLQLSIDLTDPTVTCSTATFTANQPAALVHATVSDGTSGPVATAISAAADTSSAGTHTVLVTGEDRAGRQTTVSCPYTVTYRFTGFTAPVDNPPVINRAKAGQSIPIKWMLTDYFGTPVADPASFVSVTSGSTTCGGNDPLDDIETYSGGSGLQYLGSGVWQFNWSTPKGYAGQCRVMRLNLADGDSSRTASFQFK